MTFLALSAAWLAALLVPLIAFYFLKLKRPRHDISSLVLWRQVIADQRVNSPFQKFKRNLLLLLQILLLTLLVLAAMQPLLRSGASRAERLPVLIDVSASMAGLEKAGGVSRLDAAKTKVRELIANLPSDQQLCLIAFSKTARRLTGFTNNKAELRDALAALEVDDVAGDLEEALRTAQALARGAAFDRVLLFSDGNFPAQTNFELSFRIDFQRLDPAGPNFGITACNARRGVSGQWDVFVQLGGPANAESTTGTVELIEDGAAIASENVTLVGGAAPRLVFKVSGEKPALIEARFTPRGFDSLAADNRAWLTLPTVRPLAVYVPPALASFRHALDSIDGLTLFPRDDAPLPAAYDLVFANAEADLALPARVICSVGFVPPDLQKLVTVESGNANVIDWKRDSPLLQHVTMSDVLLMDDPHQTANVTESTFANLGYEIVAHGPHGPLIVARADSETQRVHLLFHTDRSTLPYRVAFPIFISNLVNSTLRQAKIGEVEAARTGVLPALTLVPTRNYRVEGPAGFSREAGSDERGQLTGVPAPKAGEYKIRDGAGNALSIGASVLSASETSLASVEQIEFNDRLKVSAASVPVSSDRPLWWPLALAGFGVLLVEWWFFNRRSVMAR